MVIMGAKNNTNNEKHQALTIYKASAGSGKTFTLAVQYITIVIKNPYHYRNILAVTFTNKATDEMKMRILSQLYGISKGLEDSSNYLNKIKDATGFSVQMIRIRAAKALELLLHNYSYFRVETIDSFFQSVLRNLARELDLTANLRIELNDQQVQQKAVDKLIEELKPEQKVLKWILEYIAQNISDDKSWNVIGQIKSFGNNIFSSEYKEHHDELQKVLSQPNFFKNYVAKIRGIERHTLKEFQDKVDRFEKILDNYNVTIDDLSSKSRGPASYFNKLKKLIFTDDKLCNKTLSDALDNPSKWLSKAQKGNRDLEKMSIQLTQLLNESETCRKNLLRPYRTAQLTLRYLNQLRLLSSIEQKVKIINDESNSFLLSDTQNLLNELIEDSDSPFIFEKIGTQLKYIMIDEFQDTSTIQWKNFKILLQETMSQEDSSNLIVGDVKQSIYRWRSADWRLLNNIEHEFPHKQELLKIEPLAFNYRSERNVVEFNNHFFEITAQNEYNELTAQKNKEAEQMQRAYQDTRQKVPVTKGNNGYVSIKLLPNEEYQEAMNVEIVNTVQLLLANGSKPSSIAILIRTKKDIPTIADLLMQNLKDVKLVSDEAFRLDASDAVNILIDALHCLNHPDDNLARANLAKAYKKLVLNNDVNDNQLFIKGTDINQLLPKEYIEQFNSLLTLPAIDLIERLFHIFELEKLKEQSAYMCAFYDILSQYLTNNHTGIDSFLDEWNETLHEKTIQADGFDGIRILTIHKSKGLEFEHVIVPYCDWKLEIASTLWCQTQEKPFSELPLIPIICSEGTMKDTYFENSYKYEHLQNVVDNMNLLYVAFTRAGKNLFIIGKRQTKGRRSKIIEDSLERLHQELIGSILEGDINNREDVLCFEYGSLYIPEEKQKKQSSNVFCTPIKIKNIEIESFNNKVSFRQSNQSRDFVQQQEGEEDTQQNYIKLGNILHQLFSQIKTTEDILPVLQQLEFEGVLYDEVITRDNLQTMLKKRFKNKQVAEWFSSKWKLFNECNIICKDPLTGEVITHRPDRVMTDGNEMIVVDFKFGKPKPQYNNQIRRYMSLLRNMNYHNIKGYLWYVYSNQIEEVK